MNNLSSDSKSSMLTRVVTACVIALIGFPTTILGGWYFFAIIMFLLVVAIYEFIHAPNKNRYNFFIYAVVYVMTLSFVLWQFFKPFLVTKTGSFLQMTNINFSTAGIIFYFLMLFVICLFSEKFTIGDATYLFTMGIYVAVAFAAILFLRYLPCDSNFYGQDLKSCVLFFYILTGTYMTDIGAYFVGVLFGKHKMAPRISPHKTWEGFVGGVLFSTLFSFLFAFTCEKLGAPLLPGVLDFTGINWLWVLTLSLLMPLSSNFGDLIFSAMKRNFMIKDFGRIFPGHGGVLDRVDSLSFTASVAALLIIFLKNGWNFLL